MLLATDYAFAKTFGLAVTFIGINIIVFILIGYIAFQIHGERRQNKAYAASRSANGAEETFPPGS